MGYNGGQRPKPKEDRGKNEKGPLWLANIFIRVLWLKDESEVAKNIW